MRRAFVGALAATVFLGMMTVQQPAQAESPFDDSSTLSAKKPKKQRARGKARVTVRLDKPKSLKVKVIFKGRGTKRVLRRSKVIRGLTPGKYTVRTTGSRIQTNKGTYFAPFKRRSITVAPKSHQVVPVLYGFRPKATKVKAERQITVLGGDLTSTATMKVAGGANRGDVIVSAPSAAFPDGVLVKVVSVRKGVATTNPATLTDAIPAGSFVQSTTGSVSVDEGSELAGIPSGDKSPFWKKISCSVSGDASVTGTAEARISVTMDTGWGGWAKPWLELRGDASAGADVTLAVAGQGTCTIPRTALLAHPVVLPRVQFTLYGVPVWLDNSLQFYVEGSASATASLATTAGVAVTTNAGVRIGSGQRTWFNPPTLEKTFTPPTVHGKATGEVWLGADVQSMVYGQVGGALGLDIGPKLVADSSTRPWWTLSLQARGTGRINSNIPLLRGEHPFPQIGYFAMEIANSGSEEPDQSGDTTTPGAVRRITSYSSTSDLRCSLFTAEDTNGEFYGDEGNACGTFLSVDGRLFGPMDIPARDDFGEYWTPVSQTTTGTGTSADPYVTKTVVSAGDTGISLEQHDTWALNSDLVSTQMRVRNTSGIARTVRLTRAADCYIGDDDVGTGELSVSAGYAGCLRSSQYGMITLRLQALGNSPTVAEDYYDSVWNLVNDQSDLPNTCRCSEEIDNGVATSWELSVPAGSSRVRTGEFSLRRA